MIRTRVGYTGGSTADPTYRRMGDHTEALQIDFDPEVLSYDDLLAIIWSAHDPTKPSYSTQYRAAIWADGDGQMAAARHSGERAAAARRGALATAIEPLGPFHRAEDYHQKYRLRRQQTIVAELVARYGSDRAMVDSTAAARLNGMLSGHGGRDEVARIVPTLDLSPASELALQSTVDRF